MNLENAHVLLTGASGGLGSATARALIARGLLVRADDPTPMAAPRPIDDLERVIERIRRMLTRAPQPG